MRRSFRVDDFKEVNPTYYTARDEKMQLLVLTADLQQRLSVTKHALLEDMLFRYCPLFEALTHVK
jgi:hypothetical protein